MTRSLGPHPYALGLFAPNVSGGLTQTLAPERWEPTWEHNRALAQMDEAIQQNSALVEENAATAKTLEHQAQAMDEQISFFRMDGAGQRTMPAPAAAVPMAATPRAKVPAPQQAAMKPRRAVPQLKQISSGGGAAVRRAAPAADADDWKEF